MAERNDIAHECSVRMEFLGLPLEIRQKIWYIIHKLLVSSHTGFPARGTNPWISLATVCKQLSREVIPYFNWTIVPYRQVGKFIGHDYNTTMVASLTRVCLEVPCDTSGQDLWPRLSSAICRLGPVLRDLRLFFVEDGTNSGADSQNQLVRDVQTSLRGRLLILDSLLHLPHLRRLSVTNAGFPISQGHLLKQKPNLQYLCVLAGPGVGEIPKIPLPLLVPPASISYRIKHVELSADAAIGSYQIPTRFPDLESLYWTIPASLGKGINNEVLQSCRMFTILASNRYPNFRCLHLRIEARLCADHSDANLMTLIECLSSKLSLRELEIKTRFPEPVSRSFEEISNYLPPNLRRLACSENLIPVNTFHRALAIFTYPDPFVLAEESDEDTIAGFSSAIALRRLRYLEHLSYEYETDDSTKFALLRLNGYLKDRALNPHLFYGHEPRRTSIPPKTKVRQ